MMDDPTIDQLRAHALEAALRTPMCQRQSDVLDAARQYLKFLQGDKPADTNQAA